MEFLLKVVFGVIDIFDVPSYDSDDAAFKRARRAGVLCTMAWIAFLALAFAFAPSDASDQSPSARAVTVIYEYVGNGFAFAAMVGMVGMLWFSGCGIYFLFKMHRDAE